MVFKLGYCPECDAVRHLEVRRVDQMFLVRGEAVTVSAPAVFCTTCGEDVFDRELDFAALEMAYAEYRRRKGLPGPAEIAALRDKYGLGQRTLAKLLGWSPATVYRYEKGAVPVPAHGEMLKRLDDPREMARLAEQAAARLSPRERSRLERKLCNLLEEEQPGAARSALESRQGLWPPGLETGFRRFDFEKLLNMMLFFAGREGIYKTALMKLLWYADFLHFKRHAVSITGTRYAALPNGPAPDGWLLCLVAAEEAGAAIIDPVFLEGLDLEAEVFRPQSAFDPAVFSKEELATLRDVAARLRPLTSRVLADLSHREDGWKLTGTGGIISYEHALGLSLD